MVLADKVDVVKAVSITAVVTGSVRVVLCVVETLRVEKSVREMSSSVLEVSTTVDVMVENAVTVMVLAGRVFEIVEVVWVTPAAEQAAWIVEN